MITNTCGKDWVTLLPKNKFSSCIILVGVKSPRLVLVTWIDSVTYGGWKFPDEVNKWMDNPASKIESVGYLIRENKDVVVIASSKTEGAEKQHSALTLIPKVAIKKIKTLKS
jgi:hypothetical protein